MSNHTILPKRPLLAALAGAALATSLMVPQSAYAWWHRGWGWGPRFGIGITVPVAPPPVYYAPPPAYAYAYPPPVYYPRARAWIPPHRNWAGAWIPGHYVWR
ncbi:MAG: hypothetical protein ACYCZB_05455 [Acidiphilium sp.]